MTSNAEFDRADLRAEQEREAKIAAVGAALRRAGTKECMDCGCSILLARLRVYPSASRCLECQTLQEQERLRR